MLVNPVFKIANMREHIRFSPSARFPPGDKPHEGAPQDEGAPWVPLAGSSPHWAQGAQLVLEHLVVRSVHVLTLADRDRLQLDDLQVVGDIPRLGHATPAAQGQQGALGDGLHVDGDRCGFRVELHVFCGLHQGNVVVEI